MQSYPEFQRTLEELRAEWKTGGLIHGDLKWDNCVVYRAPGKPMETRIVIPELDLDPITHALQLPIAVDLSVDGARRVA